MKQKQNVLDDQLFSNAFNNAAIGMALVAPDGKWLKVNQSICNIVGYEPEELLKIDFQTITHPEDLNLDLDLLNEVIDRKRDSYQMEKRYYHKDGSIVWVILSVSLVRDKDGNPRYFISQIQDITERKQKEDQLKMVITSTSDGIWDWYLQEDYEFMSPRFWEIFGYEPHEKKHHPSEWQKLIFEEDLPIALQNFEKHVQSKGQHPFTQEVRYHHKDGSTVWVLCQGKVVEWDKDGNPVRMIGTHTDITEFKRVQQELEYEKHIKVHSAKLASLGQMAGGIAHEINNPLAILSGHAGVLLGCIKKEEIPVEKIEKSAHAIQQTVMRIAKVIDGLRNFARDGRDDELEVFSLRDLVDEVHSLCADRFKRHEVQLEVTDSVEGVNVYGQRVQLAQVMINLVNNASDAIKELEEKWIKIRCEESAKEVKIFVEDSGDGIPEEIQDKMMRPFFTTKSAGEGTGIGLSLSKNIIEKHFGQLIVNDNSKHTSLMVVLPKMAQKKQKAS